MITKLPPWPTTVSSPPVIGVSQSRLPSRFNVPCHSGSRVDFVGGRLLFVPS